MEKHDMELRPPNDSTVIVHHRSSEYDVLICCVDAVGRMFHVQIASVGEFITYGCIRKEDQPLEDFVQLIAVCGKKQMMDVVMHSRKELEKIRGSYYVRN